MSPASPQAAGAVSDPFDEGFLRRLSALELVARRLLAGQQRAERKTRKLGAGLEFADHRQYTPGDDLRDVDWGVLARLDQPLVRMYEQDEDLPLRILVDVSASMATRGGAKLRLALQLAAALAWIALSGLDRVGVHLASSTTFRTLPPARGRARRIRVLEFLRGASPGGATDLLGACTRLGAEARQPGVTVIISDFYDLTGAFAGPKLLRYKRHEPALIQVIDPREADPRGTGLRGDVALLDVEGGPTRELTLDPATLDAFHRAHEAFCERLRVEAARRGIPCYRVDTQATIEDIVLGILRDERLLR